MDFRGVVLRNKKRRLATVAALAVVLLGTGGLEIYGRMNGGQDFDSAHAATPSHLASAAVAAVGMKISDFLAAVGITRMLPERPDKLHLKGEKVAGKGFEPKAFAAVVPPGAAPPAGADVAEPMAFSAVAPDAVPAELASTPSVTPPTVTPTRQPFINPPLPGGGGTIGPIPQPPTTAVPEPGSWLLMIGGFGMVGAQLRRRQKVPLAGHMQKA